MDSLVTKRPVTENSIILLQQVHVEWWSHGRGDSCGIGRQRLESRCGKSWEDGLRVGVKVHAGRHRRRMPLAVRAGWPNGRRAEWAKDLRRASTSSLIAALFRPPPSAAGVRGGDLRIPAPAPASGIQT
jgi:hypothetical protein